MICVTWPLLIDVIYSGEFVCSGGLECEKCFLEGSIYISEV